MMTPKWSSGMLVFYAIIPQRAFGPGAPWTWRVTVLPLSDLTRTCKRASSSGMLPTVTCPYTEEGVS